MKSKIIFLTVIALIGSFIAGFMVANSLNKSEIAKLRGETVNKPQTTAPASQNPSETTLSEEEIRARLSEADNNPENISFQRNLGMALYKYAAMKQEANILMEVTRLLGRVYENDKKDYEILVTLGNCYFDAGLLKKDDSTLIKSRKYYSEALELQPKDADVRTDLGLSYFLTTPPDVEKALEFYKKSFQDDPSNEKTPQAIARAYFDQNNVAETEKYLALLEKVNPENTNLIDIRSKLKTSTSGGK